MYYDFAFYKYLKLFHDRGGLTQRRVCSLIYTYSDVYT